VLDSVFGTGPHDHPRLTGNQRRGSWLVLLGVSLTARVTFDGASFRVGSRAAMWFGAAAPRAAFDPSDFEFVLSCIRESPHAVLRLRPALARLAEVRPVVCEYDDAEREFRLEFDLPPGLPGADLLANEPVYWDLSFAIHDPIGVYAGRFLVPVA
jgi:hypothetical protein